MLRAPLPAEAFAPLSLAPPNGSPLLARRVSRVAFGVGLLVAAAAVLVGLVLEARPVALWLLLALPIGLLAGGVGGLVGGTAWLRQRVDDEAWAWASFALPAAGIALVAPITLQLLFYVPATLVLLATSEHVWLDNWIPLTLGFTVHVHLLFAGFLVADAARIRRGLPMTSRLPGLVACTLASALPGAILIFPPALVFGTGLAVWTLFRRAAHRWAVGDAAAAQT